MAEEQLNDLDKIFEGVNIVFPPMLLKIRRLGTELVTALILLSIGADPVHDFIEFQSVHYQFNTTYFDIALFILFITILPMILWTFFIGFKESIKNYW